MRGGGGLGSRAGRPWATARDGTNSPGQSGEPGSRATGGREAVSPCVGSDDLSMSLPHPNALPEGEGCRGLGCLWTGLCGPLRACRRGAGARTWGAQSGPPRGSHRLQGMTPTRGVDKPRLEACGYPFHSRAVPYWRHDAATHPPPLWGRSGSQPRVTHQLNRASGPRTRAFDGRQSEATPPGRRASGGAPSQELHSDKESTQTPAVRQRDRGNRPVSGPATRKGRDQPSRRDNLRRLTADERHVVDRAGGHRDSPRNDD